MTDKRIAEILEFWFADTRADPSGAGNRMAFWFKTDNDRDRQIKQNFAGHVEDARAGRLEGWHASSEGQLALIILLDQLPRNIFRGSQEAFASDENALAICMQGIAAGDDRKLGPVERIFYYMPLQHAESIEAQENAVKVFDALARTVAPELRKIFEGCADFARQHHDIIEKFGRFPHRNSIFGRTSTAQEESFLASGGATFGQG